MLIHIGCIDADAVPADPRVRGGCSGHILCGTGKSADGFHVSRLRGVLSVRIGSDGIFEDAGFI